MQQDPDWDRQGPSTPLVNGYETSSRGMVEHQGVSDALMKMYEMQRQQSPFGVRDIVAVYVYSYELKFDGGQAASDVIHHRCLISASPQRNPQERKKGPFCRSRSPPWTEACRHPPELLCAGPSWRPPPLGIQLRAVKFGLLNPRGPWAGTQPDPGSNRGLKSQKF